MRKKALREIPTTWLRHPLSVRLDPDAFQRLEQLAQSWHCSHGRALDRLILAEPPPAVIK